MIEGSLVVMIIGVRKYPNGDSYKGQIKDGLLNGKGSYYIER